MRFSEKDKALLASAGLHVGVMMTLAALQFSGLGQRRPMRAEPIAAPPPALEVARRVWLPPKQTLQELLPRVVRPRPASERISVGPPSSQRARELILRREDDLTAVARGRSGRVPRASATRDSAPGQRSAAGAAATPRTAAGRAPVQPSTRTTSATPAVGQSIADTARHWGERLHDAEAQGLASGTGHQVGPLFFDPAGADFTVWVNHFKNEVYRNWIVPQSVLMGLRGQVDLEFVVDRSGKMVALRLLRSSGTAVLDRAAQNALLSSRQLPLPADYAPPTVTMQARFVY